MKNLKLLGAFLWIGVIFSFSNENSDSEVFISNIQNDYHVSIEKVRELADNFASEKNVKSLVGKKSYTYIKCSLNNMYGCKRGKIWTIANTKTINLNAVYKTYKFIKIEIDDNMEI